MKIIKKFSTFNTNTKDYFKAYIELRSDVKTLPTKKMRESVLDSLYGDDMFEEDPTMKKLQYRICDLFGMSSSIFCPSGTMANILSLHLYSNRNDYVILGHKSHLSIIEKPQLEHNQINPIRITNNINGSLCMKSLSNTINSINEKHKIKVLALEDTHNFCGGQILPRNHINEIKEYMNNSEKLNLKYHLDGSRILNSSVEQNISPKDIVKGYDTINICLSKGVGAPVGSMVLMKNNDDYEKAKSFRKIFGGSMRQAGFLAAPALVALDDFHERFVEDHKNAKLFEEMILNQTTAFHIKAKSQTNIVNLYCAEDKRPNLKSFVDTLREEYKVLIISYPENLRAVFHHQVSKEQTIEAANLISSLANKMLI